MELWKRGSLSLCEESPARQDNEGLEITDAHQRLRIAINNYRAAGSAGYTMFRDAKVVWRSSVDMRDLMIQYFMENKTLRAQPDHNWRIVPREAAETLKNQALKDAARPQSQ